jgi:hypothetical protein
VGGSVRIITVLLVVRYVCCEASLLNGH